MTRGEDVVIILGAYIVMQKVVVETGQDIALVVHLCVIVVFIKVFGKLSRPAIDELLYG
jgi:hypothetical protein